MCHEILPYAAMPFLRGKMTKMLAKSGKAERPRIVILVYDGLCTFEYGIAVEVFGLYRPELGGYLYDVSSVSVEKRPLRAAGGIVITATGTLDELEQADTVVVPGWRGKDEIVPKRICDAVRTAHDRGARLVSVCSGIYVLAAAGLLSNRRATTHWRYVEDFSSRFPDVDIQPNELYVDEGDIITSAGSSAGIDACLHIVRSDYGPKIGNSVARRLVMHSHRQGGQAQFIEQPLPKTGGSHRLSQMMDEIRARIGEDHQISSMARLAGMSPRTFQRRFLAFTGVPAKQWLVQERLSRSCLLLETTDMSVDRISEAVGFSTAEALRYHFRKALLVSPMDYRRRFRREPSSVA
jgi:AraC family transcriptional regulator, transcriptional activator FtrA